MTKIRSQTLRPSFESLESRVLLSAAPLAAPAFVGDAPSFLPAVNASVFPALALHLVGGKPGASASLTAPANFAAAAVSPTQVKLTWTASSGASGYYLYRSTNGGTYGKIANIGGSASSYADTTAAAGTTYAYYLVANKKGSPSVSSSAVTVTTPLPAPVTLPSSPTGLISTGTTVNSIALAWTDAATNESGYHVYRSTDGLTYTLVASLAAGSQSYADTGLASGTQYFYEVGAWNSAGENRAAPVSATAAAAAPTTTTPINIYTRYGGELVLAGTSGNDSIFVSQSGATLTIIANGATTTAAVPANGLFIYSNGGSDTITVDSSVTIRTTIATIDGAPTTISNGDPNASIWMDSTDSFSGVGSVHSVASFYEGVSKAVGISIAEPADSGATFTPSGSLWGAGPVMGDVNQGNVGDCYFLASLAAFANTTPAKLEDMAVDLGDGTYVVQYLRNGAPTFVRVDDAMPIGGFGGYAYAHPGATGDLWAVVMEKSYAYFRTGANTYASLSDGWMGTVYSDFGIANTTLSLGTTESAFYGTVANALANGMPVTFLTPSNPSNLVGDHAYTLVAVTSSGGQTLYTVRNPWGVSGDALEDGGGYATLTFLQMQANFELGAIAT